MEAHSKTDLSDVKASHGFKGLSMALIAAGVVGVLGAFGFAQSQEGGIKHFLHSYLTAYAWTLSIALAALFFVILQHLTNSTWGIAVRRVPEAIAANIWVLFVLALPIIYSVCTKNGALYPWADMAALKVNTPGVYDLVNGKTKWLNSGFFATRILLYFAIWTAFACYFYRSSVKQDESGDAAVALTQRKVSAPAMIIFALTSTFAWFDLLMSLTPTWYSTIFGVYLFASGLVGFFGLFALTCMYIQKAGVAKSAFTTEHYHDIGKFLFAFVFFWGYIAFSQYMLYWYSNIPEETEWFVHRTHGAWLNFSIFLIFGHFLLPFVGLISRHVKRSRAGLAAWSVWMLFMHYIHMFWIVKAGLINPKDAHPGIPFSLLDVLCLVGVAGIFFGLALRLIGKQAVVPLKDPRLETSLAFHQTF